MGLEHVRRNRTMRSSAQSGVHAFVVALAAEDAGSNGGSDSA